MKKRLQKQKAKTDLSIMSCAVKLIVGLGNPGSEYAETRHNAGFWLLDDLIAPGMQFLADKKAQGDLARMELGSCDVRLLKPMLFMNRSGESVAAVCRYFNVEPEALLVAHDELDLEPGVARFKKGGGHGGHNGLRDIIRHVGTQNFQRLRIGIGHPGHRNEVANYVLKRPGTTDHNLIRQAIVQSLSVLPDWVSGQADLAMRQLHGQT